VRSNILARQNLSSRRRAPTSPQSLSPTRVAQAFHIEAVNNAPQSDACLRMDGGGCRSDSFLTLARFSLCVIRPILHILEMHVCSRLALVFFHTRPSSVFFRAGLCALDLVASFLHATSGSASFVGRSHARTKCRSSRSSVPLHMSSAETPTNVLIIGSGPAGLLAAHHLLLKGVFMCRCV